MKNCLEYAHSIPVRHGYRGMMMTFITQRGEGQGNTKKERKAAKSRGRGLEEGARRALMRQDGEEGCGERG